MIVMEFRSLITVAASSIVTLANVEQMNRSIEGFNDAYSQRNVHTQNKFIKEEKTQEKQRWHIHINVEAMAVTSFLCPICSTENDEKITKKTKFK